MSLKNLLYGELQLKGYITLDQVHAIATNNGYKQSTAERTLRSSQSGTKVFTDRDDKGQVRGYKWLGGFQIDEAVYCESEIKRRKDAYINPKLF